MTTLIRPLTEDQVSFRIEVEPECIPVRGNAMASGDDALDAEVENKILARLDRGDEWAWALVRVVARYENVEADDVLGCCSYIDEEDFKTSGYYEDMKQTALLELNGKLDSIAEAIVPLLRTNREGW